MKESTSFTRQRSRRRSRAAFHSSSSVTAIAPDAPRSAETAASAASSATTDSTVGSPSTRQPYGNPAATVCRPPVLPLKDNIPTDRFPVVTLALILANVVVYLLSIRHGGSLWGGPDNLTVFKYGAIPCEVTHPGDHIVATSSTTIACSSAGVGIPGEPSTIATIFTSMFMHGGLLHLGRNMLFLWIF